MIILFFGVV